MRIYSFIISVLAFVLLSGSEISLQAQEVNIARGKPATQSSNVDPTLGLASKAVDGNTDGAFSNGSVTHTSQGSAGGTANPWWEVDLGKVYRITKVVIYNRTDCCQNRLDSFQIMVRASNNTTSSNFAQRGRYYPGEGQTKVYSDIQVGRYVRIQMMTQKGILSLAEVQVFGTEGGAPPTPQPTPVRTPIPQPTPQPAPITSKSLVFSNESHYVVYYTVKFRHREGNEQIWKSGELGNNESKPAILPDDASKIVSIKMEYKDLLDWKLIDLIDYNKAAKDMPRKYILYGPLLEKPKFKTSN